MKQINWAGVAIYVITAIFTGTSIAFFLASWYQ